MPVAPSAFVSTLEVLEFVRHTDGVWNLPRAHVESLARAFPSVRFHSPVDQSEADRVLPEAEVVFGWAVKPSNIARAKRLRWVQITAAGVGTALFPEMVESPVILTNGRGLHGVAMAEHALGVMFAFARKLHLARDAQAARRWDQEALWKNLPAFGQVEGTTLGLVGLGSVGLRIAERAAALGVHVIAVRKHPSASPAPAHEQWGPDRLPALLERADWIVLALPTTAETRGMIDRGALARMRASAVLINLGRGSLVDESALIEALEEGRIAGAALDVFEHEPLAASSPLWNMPQVIVTPHVSGVGPRYWERAVELFARNLRAYLRGEPLENVVDKQSGY